MSLPRPDGFGSVGDWFSYVRAEGFRVPVQAPHAMSRLVEGVGWTPQEAYDHLVDVRLFVEVSGGVIVDLAATNRPVDEIAVWSP